MFSGLASTLDLHFIFQSLQLADRIYCRRQQCDDTSRDEKQEENVGEKNSEVYCDLYLLLPCSNQWVLLMAKCKVYLSTLRKTAFQLHPSNRAPKEDTATDILEPLVDAY